MKNFKMLMAFSLMGMAAHSQLSISFDSATLKKEVIHGRLLYMDSTTAQTIADPEATLERVTGIIMYGGSNGLPSARASEPAVKSLTYYTRKKAMLPEQWVIKFVQIKTDK